MILGDHMHLFKGLWDRAKKAALYMTVSIRDWRIWMQLELPRWKCMTLIIITDSRLILRWKTQDWVYQLSKGIIHWLDPIKNTSINTSKLLSKGGRNFLWSYKIVTKTNIMTGVSNSLIILLHWLLRILYSETSRFSSRRLRLSRKNLKNRSHNPDWKWPKSKSINTGLLSQN